VFDDFFSIISLYSFSVPSSAFTFIAISFLSSGKFTFCNKPSISFIDTIDFTDSSSIFTYPSSILFVL